MPADRGSDISPATGTAEQQERPEQRPTLGILLRIAAGASLALMVAMVKLGGEAGIENVEMIFWRFALAVPATLIWIFLGPGLASVKTRRPFAHMWRALIGLSSMYMVYWAVTLLPLAEATTINFAAPLFATALSALLLGELVGIHRWGAILVGLGGVIVVMQPSSGNLPLEGVLVALGAAIGVGSVTVVIRQISRTESAEAIVFWFSVIAMAILGGFMPWVMTAHSPLEWGILMLIGLTGGIGQIFITLSLRVAPVPVVVPFDYTQLLWVVLLGWLFFADMPHEATWAGAAIIVASGLYTLYREQRAARLARGAGI